MPGPQPAECALSRASSGTLPCCDGRFDAARAHRAHRLSQPLGRARRSIRCSTSSVSKRPAADLFCFQEAIAASELLDLDCGFRTTLYRDLAEALPEFDGAFDPVVSWPEPTPDGREIQVPFGLATFARRTLPIATRRAARVIDHQDTLDAVPGLHGIIRWLQLTSCASRPAPCWSRTTTASRARHQARQRRAPGAVPRDPPRPGRSRRPRGARRRLQPPARDRERAPAGARPAQPRDRARDPIHPQPSQPVLRHAPGAASRRLRLHLARASGRGLQVPDVQISDHLPMILDLT